MKRLPMPTLAQKELTHEIGPCIRWTLPGPTEWIPFSQTPNTPGLYEVLYKPDVPERIAPCYSCFSNYIWRTVDYSQINAQNYGNPSNDIAEDFCEGYRVVPEKDRLINHNIEYGEG